jgi:hypothetical protein
MKGKGGGWVSLERRERTRFFRERKKKSVFFKVKRLLFK